MATHQDNAALNDLLVTLRRSLLQYVGESWPWTASGIDGEREAIGRLVARQEAHVRGLAELLGERGWAIDFGVFPAEYTDLHYLALDYLLRLLVQSETAVLRQVEETSALCSGDPDAWRLLQATAADQREIVRRLTELAGSRRDDSSTRLAG